MKTYKIFFGGEEIEGAQGLREDGNLAADETSQTNRMEGDFSI